MPPSVLPSTSTEPSARSSLILLFDGLSDTSDSDTVAVVARAPASVSLFNTLATAVASQPSMRPAVYSNFIDGTTSWKGTAPESGEYTVRVALLHADAKRASKVDYELDVALR